jgi:CBS domain-containing protein
MLMVDRGVNRLPVIDEAGRVVGILTRDDVLRTVATLAGRELDPKRYPRLLPE